MINVIQKICRIQYYIQLFRNKSNSIFALQSNIFQSVIQTNKNFRSMLSRRNQRQIIIIVAIQRWGLYHHHYIHQ